MLDRDNEKTVGSFLMNHPQNEQQKQTVILVDILDNATISFLNQYYDGALCAYAANVIRDASMCYMTKALSIISEQVREEMLDEFLDDAIELFKKYIEKIRRETKELYD